MKIYIIFALVALTVAEEWKLKSMEDWSKIHRACDERYHVSEELLEKARHDKYPPIEVFEVALCILRHIDVWNDSKGFSTDKFMMGLESAANEDNVSKQFLRESLEKCNDDNSERSAPLDWAFRCFKCYIDNERLFKSIKKVRFFEH